MNTTRNLLATTLVVAAIFARGEVKLGAPFADGMVLQREMPVPVWGRAAPGETVRVRFADQCVETVAKADGTWRVNLAPLATSKESRTLTAEGLNALPWWNFWGTSPDCACVRDVLVGEVWFCAGQSNTEFAICGTSPHYRDSQGAMHVAITRKPFVRFAKTPHAWCLKPADEVKVTWQKMMPEMRRAPFGKPSAMGWYYALTLAETLDIPIGLVDSSWGGTNIDAWTPRCGIESRADLSDVAALPLLDAPAFQKAREKGGVYYGPEKGIYGQVQQQPTVLWNGMVAPYAPMAMRGFIWYQGCHNSGEYKRYPSKMHALYNGWSKAFENSNLKLYFVQLTPWGNPIIPHIQEAQAIFAAAEPHAGMAVINDCGNLKDVHPSDKRTVGKRLALFALARDYGITGFDPESPALRNWRIEKDAFVLEFNHVREWYLYNPDWSCTTGFEVAGADGKFVPAEIDNLLVKKPQAYESDGRIKGVELRVRAPGVTAPKKLRYLHSAPWYGALHNELDLPLGAFHIGE